MWVMKQHVSLNIFLQKKLKYILEVQKVQLIIIFYK
jgi:hypothetical protein